MAVTITKPASGATLAGTVSVEATYSGQNFDIATVTFNGQQLGSDSAQPIVFSADTTKVVNGARTLTVAVRYRAPGGKLRWQKASIPVMVSNVVTPPAKPTVPTGLSATPADAKVILDWNDNPSAQGVDRYQVYTAAGANLDLNVVGSQYTVTNLVNGQQYGFRVSAHNSAGYGDWGPIVSATPNGSPPFPPNVSRSSPTVVVTA